MKSEPAASKMLIVNDTGPAAMYREINRESSLPIIATPAEPIVPISLRSRSRRSMLSAAVLSAMAFGLPGFYGIDYSYEPKRKEITPYDTARLEAARVKRERKQARKP